jgi:hypothetical protein
MKTALRFLACLSLLLITCNARAQSEHENDDPIVTTSLGIPLIVALNPTARFVSGGWGVNTGVGYNRDHRNALIGEFMGNTLNPTNEVLQPIRVALQSPNISGYTRPLRPHRKLSIRATRQDVQNVFHRQWRVVSP